MDTKIRNFVKEIRGRLNLGSLKEWRERGRGLMYLYQRAFFYTLLAKNELLKPLGFWNETVLILTFLSVRFNFNPALTTILLTYLIFLALMSVAGKILVITGVPKYNTSINNRENPELLEVLERLKRVENLLQEKKNFSRPVDSIET